MPQLEPLNKNESYFLCSSLPGLIHVRETDPSYQYHLVPLQAKVPAAGGNALLSLYGAC